MINVSDAQNNRVLLSQREREIEHAVNADAFDMYLNVAIIEY